VSVSVLLRTEGLARPSGGHGNGPRETM